MSHVTRAPCRGQHAGNRQLHPVRAVAAASTADFHPLRILPRTTKPPRQSLRVKTALGLACWSGAPSPPSSIGDDRMPRLGWTLPPRQGGSAWYGPWCRPCQTSGSCTSRASTLQERAGVRSSLRRARYANINPPCCDAVENQIRPEHPSTNADVLIALHQRKPFG